MSCKDMVCLTTEDFLTMWGDPIYCFDYKSVLQSEILELNSKISSECFADGAI